MKMDGNPVKTENKNPGKGLIASAVSLILIVAVIIVNIIVALIPGKYSLLDATSIKMYSISEATRKYLTKMNDDVTVYIVDSDGSNLKFETFVERYSEYGDHLKLEYISTSENPGFLSEHGYNSDSINAYSVVVESAKRSKVIDYNEMFYYTNDYLGNMAPDTYTYYYQLFSSSASYEQYLYYLVYYSHLYFQGESLITSAIEYTLLDTVPHAYYITGHGEEDMSSTTLGKFIAGYNIEFEALDIASVTKIPDDANCLVINAPELDYSDAETELIRNYLANGGRLTLLTDSANTSMPNLMSVVEYYGVSASDELVAIGEGDSKTYDLKPAVNSDHDSLYYASSYTPGIVNANAIKTSDNLRDAVVITDLLTTSTDAYLGDDTSSNASYSLGVSIEEETDSGTTKIIWFTGADSFGDEKATQVNCFIVYLAMSWMSEAYASSLGTINPLLYDGTYLNVSGTSAAVMGVIIIILIPAAVITAGIIIFRKRRRA